MIPIDAIHCNTRWQASRAFSLPTLAPQTALALSLRIRFALGELRHRGLARGCVAVRRRAVVMIARNPKAPGGGPPAASTPSRKTRYRASYGLWEAF
jgi:hypothetical protein